MCSSGVVKQNKLYFTLTPLESIPDWLHQMGSYTTGINLSLTTSDVFLHHWNQSQTDYIRWVLTPLGSISDWLHEYTRCVLTPLGSIPDWLHQMCSYTIGICLTTSAGFLHHWDQSDYIRWVLTPLGSDWLHQMGSYTTGINPRLTTSDGFLH